MYIHPLRHTVEGINERKPSNSKLRSIELVPSVYAENGKIHSRVKCVCECGVVKDYNVSAIIRGTTTSCGCSKKMPRPKRSSKYPLHLRKVYRGMVDRCYNKKNIGFKMYGKKGVKVCDLWLQHPEEFYKWAIENGWSKGLHIDKDIKGNSLLYSPENCTIVTVKVNNENRIYNKKAV